MPAVERRAAFADLIRPFAISGPDDYGYCRTRTSDGGHADSILMREAHTSW